MNRDAPAQTRAYPALSGEVWDNTTDLNERTTSVEDAKAPAAKADPLTTTSQVLKFASGRPD